MNRESNPTSLRDTAARSSATTPTTPRNHSDAPPTGRASSLPQSCSGSEDDSLPVAGGLGLQNLPTVREPSFGDRIGCQTRSRALAPAPQQDESEAKTIDPKRPFAPVRELDMAKAPSCCSLHESHVSSENVLIPFSSKQAFTCAFWSLHVHSRPRYRGGARLHRESIWFVVSHARYGNRVSARETPRSRLSVRAFVATSQLESSLAGSRQAHDAPVVFVR
jgi:hypothetical protein